MTLGCACLFPPFRTTEVSVNRTFVSAVVRRRRRFASAAQQRDKARAAAIDRGYRAGAGTPSTVATAPGRGWPRTRKNAPQNGAS